MLLKTDSIYLGYDLPKKNVLPRDFLTLISSVTHLSIFLHNIQRNYYDS